MHFTDKEIELARQLKEDGLSWKPQGGDWYVNRDGDVELLTFMSMIMWSEYESLPIENKIWLPLWHQCRKTLADNDLYIFILLLTKKDADIQLGVWKHDGVVSDASSSQAKCMGLVRGETDLEAIYQAIKLFVLNKDSAGG